MELKYYTFYLQFVQFIWGIYIASPSVLAQTVTELIHAT